MPMLLLYPLHSFALRLYRAQAQDGRQWQREVPAQKFSRPQQSATFPLGLSGGSDSPKGKMAVLEAE